MSDAQEEYENKQTFQFPKETSELETKPKRTFDLYPNVIVKERDTGLKPSNPKETHNSSSANVTEKQRDNVLKLSNGKQIRNTTFDFPKQKTKLTSKHLENPIGKNYLNEKLTKNNPNNKKQISKITSDSFIDELVEFEQTVISKGNDVLSAQQVLQREFESRILPPIELKHFDGSSELWPEFIDHFYSRVHRMASFDNNLEMDCLLSVFDGDAKGSIQSIGSSGILRNSDQNFKITIT